VKHIISLGAGVQSSTMALMAAHGEITPMPECAIFADTQSEPKAVYTWLDWLETQLPFPVHRVTAGSLRDDLMAEGRAATPPFFVQGGGMLWRQCTNDYKIAPIRRKIRELTDQCVLWMGISTDEAQRMKPSTVKYIANIYPLIDASISRIDCIAWMVSRGYSEPPRSACTFCPYHDDRTWRDMKLNDTESFADAVVVDAAIRSRGGNREWYLHRSCKPLNQVDFRTAEDAGQMSMFDEACEGMCGV
jgi:hypothetical protein